MLKLWLKIVLVSSAICRLTEGQVATTDLYSTAGADAVNMTSCDECSSNVILPATNVKFFGNARVSVNINVNGGITLGENVTSFSPYCLPTTAAFQLLAPFWSDVDTTSQGAVKYILTNGTETATKAKNDIVKGFPSFTGSIQWTLVVHWENVGAKGGQASVTNNFQAVVAFDGTDTYLIYYYNAIQWARGAGSYVNAKVGIDAMDTVAARIWNAVQSCSESVSNVAKNSNINDTGKYVFKISAPKIEIPDTCVGPANPQSVAQLNPPSISLYGNELVTLTNICLDVTKDAVCKFNDPLNGQQTRAAIIVNDKAISCSTPFYEQIKKVGVTVEYTAPNGTKVQVTKSVFVTERPSFPITIENLGNGSMRITWDATLIRANKVVINLNPMDNATAATELASGVANTGVAVINATLANAQNNLIATISVQADVATNLTTRLYAGVEDYYSKFWKETGAESCTSRLASEAVAIVTSACPPKIQMVKLDPEFLIDPTLQQFYHPNADECYRSNNGRIECCYKNGDLLCSNNQGGNSNSVSRRNNFWSYFNKDVIPYYACCKSSASNQQTCGNYYQKRPSNCGTGYKPPRIGAVFGDPHLNTVDGLEFTFNGKGEYNLIKTGDCDVQVRFGFLQDGQNATAVKAVAVKCSSFPNDVIHIEPDASASKMIIVSKDGEQLTFTESVSVMSINPSITISKNGPNILISVIGIGVDVGLNSGAMTVNVFVGSYLFNSGKVSGLLGDFDGKVANDLKAKGSQAALAVTSNLEDIHKKFGETWRVVETESFMIYATGSKYADFQDPAFKPRFTYPAKASFSLEVQAACGENRACYFDYQETKNLTFANYTYTFQLKLYANLNIFNVTSCKVPNLQNGFVTYTGLLAGSQAFYVCNFGFLNLGASVATCGPDGNWFWIGGAPRCSNSAGGTLDVSVSKSKLLAALQFLSRFFLG